MSFEVCRALWESTPNLNGLYLILGNNYLDASLWGKRLYIHSPFSWPSLSSVCSSGALRWKFSGISQQIFACEIFLKTGWGMLSWIPVLEQNLVVKCSFSLECLITSDHSQHLRLFSSRASASGRRNSLSLRQVNTGSGSSAHSFTGGDWFYGFLLCILRRKHKQTSCCSIPAPTIRFYEHHRFEHSLVWVKNEGCNICIL